jgi:hypothetical protein
MTQEPTSKPDYRLPTASKWATPRAVADGGGGTIIAVAEVAASPEWVFEELWNMPAKGNTQSISAERKFARVAELLSKARAVTVAGGKGFGSAAPKVNGKIFAMISPDNQFVGKLPKQRVDQLVSSGMGIHFEPRSGKSMKEWLAVKTWGQDWIDLGKETCELLGVGSHDFCTEMSGIALLIR